MSTDVEPGQSREPQKFSLKQRLPLAFLLFSLATLQGAPLMTSAAPDIEKAPPTTLFDDTLQAVKEGKKERLIVTIKKGQLDDFVEEVTELDSSTYANAPASFIDSTIPEIDTLVVTVSNKEEANFVFTDPLVESREEDRVTEVVPFVTNVNTAEYRLTTFSNSGLTGKGHRIAIVDTGAVVSGATEACFTSRAEGVSKESCPDGSGEQIGPGSATPAKGNMGFHGQIVAETAFEDANKADFTTVNYFSQSEKDDGNLYGWNSDRVRGMIFASKSSPDAVVIASGTDFSSLDESAAFERTVDIIAAHGGIVVVSAGNDGRVGLPFPANQKGVIPIGATSFNADTNETSFAGYSNISPHILAEDGAVEIGNKWWGGTSVAVARAGSLIAIINQAQEREGKTVKRMSAAQMSDHLAKTGEKLSETREGIAFNPVRIIWEKAIGLQRLFFPFLNLFSR